MASSSLTSPLDANAFASFSPGWLESLDAGDLEALELELEEALDARLGREKQSQAEIDQACAGDPLHWLQQWTATENPKHEAQGLPYRAPFPRKSYFVPLFEEFRTAPILFIPKTREMLTSWCVMGDSAHRAQWHRWFTVVQTDAEAKAQELISYVSCLWRNQPEWMRKLHPIANESLSNIEWANGGRVLAIPAGAKKIRLYHPTRYVMDEAAFLAEAEACYNAAKPVCQQIVAISSAGPGWFGDECSR